MPPMNNFQRSVISLAIGQALLLSSASQAATITVTDPSDDAGANCSLRAALGIVNSGTAGSSGCEVVGALGTNDQINFSLPGGSTIMLDGSALEITSTVSINGPGAEQLSIDANQQSRAFFVNGAADTIIDGLTVTGGTSSANGGGISIADSPRTTVSNSVITENISASRGGAIHITSSNSASVSNSTISNNMARRGGNGIYIVGSDEVLLSNTVVTNNVRTDKDFTGYGGGMRIIASDSIRLESVVVSNNESTQGGGILMRSLNDAMIVDSQIIGNEVRERDDPGSGGIPDGGGIYADEVSYLTIQNTTISNNVADFQGGGIAFIVSNNLLLDSSTVSNNQANRGGGVFLGVPLNSTGQSENIEIVNSTISGNVANPFTFEYDYYGSYDALGGGISSYYVGGLEIVSSTINDNQVLGANAQGGGVYTENSSNISLANSIIANSVGQDCAEGATAAPISIDTASIIEDGSCGASRFGDPGLLTLANNGGLTQTHALSENSIARNSSIGSCLETDQRGVLRNISDGFCDVGAFEFLEQRPNLAISTSLASIIEGDDGTTAFSFTVSRSVNVLGASSVDYTVTGSGSSPVDPADFGGSFPSGTIAFADGESSKIETISISGDTDIEPDEMFTVSLSNPINAEIGADSIVATIVNDDVDTDEDGTVDSIDPDDDNDTVPDSEDNCQFIENPNQQDTDSDLFGDACDDDDDGDNIADIDDVCPFIPDPDQADRDNDGIGDACGVEDEICFTIKTASGNVATICL